MEDKDKPSAAAKPTTTKDEKKKKEDEDISQEDRKLQEDLTMLVTRVMEHRDASQQTEEAYLGVQLAALEAIRKEIRSSTSSMTAIPKPLKYLRPFYSDLVEFFQDPVRMSPSSPNRPLLADILSVLAMTVGDPARAVLRFRSEGSKDALSSWGNEYLRALAGEIGAEYQYRTADEDEDEEEDAEKKSAAGGAMGDIEEKPERNRDVTDLLAMSEEIVKYNFDHANEYEAVDLLIEVDQLDRVVEYLSAENVTRVCKYILASASYVGDVEDANSMVKVVVRGYLSQKKTPAALLAALRLPEPESLVRECFETAAALDEDSEAALVQLGYILSVQRVYYSWIADDFDVAAEPAGNVKLSQQYLELARDLGVADPKSPADVYKAHLEEGRSARRPRVSSAGGPTVDSAMENLASTFVNAFVNVGHGSDALILNDSEWLFKNKGSGMMTAAASVGMLKLWDVEEGFSAVDKFSHSKEPFIKAGYALASGVVSCGVSSDMNASFALLSEVLETPSASLHQRLGALLGLGIAYVNSANQDILDLVLPLVVDGTAPIEVVSVGCLALGLVFAGTSNDEILGSMFEIVIERCEGKDLDNPIAKLVCIGMGLLYLGSSTSPEIALMLLESVTHPIKMYIAAVIETFAYMGTGDVAQIQRLLRLCTERIYKEEDDEEEEEKKASASSASVAGARPATASSSTTPSSSASSTTTPSSSSSSSSSASSSSSSGAPGSSSSAEEKSEEPEVPHGLLRHLHQGASVVGLAAVAMGESLASTMCLRSMDHLIQCGEVNIRRAVPLALALLSVSNPQLPVMDTLTKLAHDQDMQISQNAVLSLGLLGAGTNNARIAQTLRGLAAYFAKEPGHLFLVRIAQGLLHMGKGLCTLAPQTFDNQLLSRPALAALLAFAHIALDLPRTILKDYHYLLFVLVPAIRPRMLFTVDAGADFAKATAGVRVGQAVDTVGQPGNPRAITGFQTHTSPVLLSANERVEMSTDEWIPVTDCLDGVIVLKKNPNATSREL